MINFEWFRKCPIQGTIKFKKKLFGLGCYRDINDIQWDIRGICWQDKDNKYVMAREVTSNWYDATCNWTSNIYTFESGFEILLWKPYFFTENTNG